MKELKDRLFVIESQFLDVMKDYKKREECNNSTLSYFRTINDNINQLKNRLQG